MNYKAFYDCLFAPVASEYGALDPDTRFHIIGFDAGGPLNYRTVGADVGEQFITCVTCELAPRPEQRANSVGTYELLMTCDDEDWCSSALTRIAQMSFDTVFDHGHTLDLQGWVDLSSPIQGIAFEDFAAVQFEGQDYGILRCHGITRSELEFAQQCDVEQLLQRLRVAGVYPRTSVRRQSKVA